jgi:cytochrome c553
VPVGWGIDGGMKKILIGLAGLVTAGAVGAILFAWSGLYNVAATRGHWAITEWFLHFAMRNSVETQSISVGEPPPLDDMAMVRLGLGHYQGGCAPCHGAPGYDGSPITGKMLPPPPWLPASIPVWTDRQLFWIVKHGIKYAGMPGWVAQTRDDEVWTMVAALRGLPDMSREDYQRLVVGDADRTSGRGSAGEGLTVCARCHGSDGAANGHVPRLAGQKQAYLEHALRSYASGERSSGIMQPVAVELSEQEIRDLAAFFAEQRDVPLSDEPLSGKLLSGKLLSGKLLSGKLLEDSRELLALGERIAMRGIPDGDVPACAGCHGVNGLAEGKDTRFPAIAGQSRYYLEQQLRLWRDGAHAAGPVGQLMMAAARKLTDEHIDALALYYAASPHPQAAAVE